MSAIGVSIISTVAVVSQPRSDNVILFVPSVRGASD